MNARLRLALFVLGIVPLMALQIAAIRNLPPWGHYRGPYGDAVASVAVFERHTTDVVNAITYDYRGVDTLGEEFILFSAVVGVLLLLRSPEADVLHPDSTPLSDTVRAFAGPAIAGSLLIGIYIAVHGQISPGGGFQGGAIAAGAPLLVYIAREEKAFDRIASPHALEFAEAVGAAGYALLGLVGLLFATPFLTNVLPLGKTGDVFSSGTIAFISFSVGIEVAAAFALVIHAYLHEMTGKH